MDKTTTVSFKVLMAGLVLGSALLGGCNRDLRKVVQSDKSQPAVVQPTNIPEAMQPADSGPTVQPTNTSEALQAVEPSPTVQPAEPDPVENEYNSLDQDLQSLNNQLKTPELPPDNP